MTRRFEPGAAMTLMLTLAWLGLVPTGAGAQDPDDWDEAQARASRPALEALLDRYERAAASPAYSHVLRQEAASRQESIRDRLDRGDFRSGDRILVQVEEHVQLSDTFAVEADRSVRLPGVGTVALDGVLRSELADRVQQAVERTIRSPRIQTHSLVRVSVAGEVNAPGFYLIDGDLPLSDLLMRAGGQTREARLQQARIDRADATILGPDAFRAALRSGATIDDIGLRDGDRLIIPQARAWLSVGRDLVYVIPALIGLVTLIT